MYPSPYNTGRPYTGLSPMHRERCPICGGEGVCHGALAPMPYSPFDLNDAAEPDDDGSVLRLYHVTVHGHTTAMRLTASDAARYGDAAIPIVGGIT